ncbi:MAG: dicarboxylate/amino acid:cation symporter [Planctomycetota bacterium]|jgi:Na+/H+-dicarboxylate symporter
MKSRLHILIFVCMAVGVVIGVLLEGASETVDGRKIWPGWADTALWWLDFFGRTLFIGALKMIIAPLILASIVAGITSMPSFRETGRVGGKTLIYYMATTTIAVVIGLILVLTIQPGNRGRSVDLRQQRAQELAERRAQYREETGRDATDPADRNAYLAWLLEVESEAKGESLEAGRFQKLVRARGRSGLDLFKEDIVQPLLTNPFKSLTESNSLGIIFFAILLALACLAVGDPARHVVAFFHGMNEVIMRITRWIMAYSPFAILCLMASIVAKHGPEVFESLGWYCGTVIGGIVIHVAVLLTICALVGRMNPLRFLKGIREAWAVAFATRSSAATLPVTVRCLTQKVGVSPKVAEFALPVGATVNMDGTALYEGVAVIFLIQIYGGMDDVGITLGGAVTLVIFVTAVLASVGAAAVPDAGLVTMVLVATAVNLPVYYIPLIFSVDAFLDMFRTSTNVMGDAVGAVVVERLEKRRLGAAESAASPEA